MNIIDQYTKAKRPFKQRMHHRNNVHILTSLLAQYHKFSLDSKTEGFFSFVLQTFVDMALNGLEALAQSWRLH